MHHLPHSAIDRRMMLQAIAGVSAMGSGVQPAGVGRLDGAPSGRAWGALSLAHRIPEAHWRADERFALLLRVLSTYRRAVDEIALGDGSGFWSPLEQIERGTASLKRRIEQLKQAGWRTGINVGVTLGHGDNADSSLPPLPFQPDSGTRWQGLERVPLPQQPGVPQLHQQEV